MGFSRLSIVEPDNAVLAMTSGLRIILGGFFIAESVFGIGASESKLRLTVQRSNRTPRREV